jgi:hypothetical protein
MSQQAEKLKEDLNICTLEKPILKNQINHQFDRKRRKEMSKYKIGDEVKVKDCEYANKLRVAGKIGFIEKVQCEGFDYRVKFLNKIESTGYYCDLFGEHELENAVKPKHNNFRKEKYSTHEVIFNYPATIVILDSGEKGISKCLPADTYDEEKGYQIALLKAKQKRKLKDLKILQNSYIVCDEELIKISEKIYELSK